MTKLDTMSNEHLRPRQIHIITLYTTKMTNAMEIAKVIQELKLRGYAGVRPLIDNLPYTDGITRVFGTQYFTCYDENDPEWKLVIFNSKLKKLEWTGSDQVELKIKEATATRSSLYPTTEPSAWCVEKAEIDTMRGYALFNTIKLRAALDAIDSGIEVAEYCGIVPVFPHPVPSSLVSRWAVETKTMRDTLVAAIKTALEERQRILGENWVLVKHIDENGNVFTFELYEMCEFTGAIRHVHTKQIIESSRPNLCIVINGQTFHKNIEKHRAYQVTFRMHEKRTHQDTVDHFDGDHSNNVPWNYRWVSRAENEFAKHSGMARRIVPDIDALTMKYGEPSGPKKLEGGWTFYDNMWIVRPNESYEKRFVAHITLGQQYPTIGVTFKDSNNKSKFRLIPCHKMVAFVHRSNLAVSDKAKEYLKSADLPETYFAESPMADDVAFSNALTTGGLVIMHFPDNDTSNYRVSNLMIGTISENQIDRQDNPATTLRKSVKLIDVVSGAFHIFQSHTEAATFLGVTVPAVWRAATINGTRKIEEYRITTSKKTGAKYYIVDA